MKRHIYYCNALELGNSNLCCIFAMNEMLKDSMNTHIIQINNKPIIKFQELYKLNILNINFCLHLELSMQWNPVSSDVMTSVSNPPIITSSVISHGSPTPQMEDGPPPSLQNNTDFMNGPVDKSFEVSPIYSFLLK